MQNRALFLDYDGRNRGAVIAILQTLIEVCRDGERGYSCAAEDVGDAWLKQLFWDYAEQRGKFAAALERELFRFGGTLVSHPTVSGWIHRKWLQIRSSLEHGSAIAMLLECERGENAARAKYEHALVTPLPAGLQDLLLEHLHEIHEAHDRLDRMRGGSLSVRLISG